ncbi:MAG TPA: hypothetical protein VMT62_03785 [Syntrophorhabdaceae bacterium]|nr:hypothetical protein [Syntrophorhabdaceae bacterium]
MLAKRDAKTLEYREKLDDLIASTKGTGPCYDAIMAYSGGKDSSYTLKLLRERYDLKVLALTFDNHFVSPTALENIRKVTDSLQVDHIHFKAPWAAMKSLFSLTASADIFSAATLLRASSICTACIGIVKSLTLKTAIEMAIPLSAFGWSPGQAPIQSAIMRTNASLIRQNQRALLSGFPTDVQVQMSSYFIPESYYQSYAGRFPTNIHPLAFFEYDEQKITDELKQIGWILPTNTDTNSTNCLLNAFANQVHLERHKFHPYVWEIANMVRQGVMTREEGMEKIYSPQNAEQVAYARSMLGLD